MLNILSFQVNNSMENDLTPGELHLLEHCIVKKIEQELKLENLENEGVILNAETFIDSFFVEIIFSNNEILEVLKEMIRNFSITENDYELINNELSILKSEELVEDITTEEEFLYLPIKRMSGYSIFDINFIEDITISLELITRFNNSIKKSKLAIFYNNEYYVFLTDPGIKHNLSTKNSYLVIDKEDFIVGSISNKLSGLDEYIAYDFYSFILGKSNQSYIDKFILEPNQLYLGYTQNVLFNNQFTILFLVMTNQKVDQCEIDSLICLEIFKNMSLNEFNKYKKAYITYFLLTNIDPRPMAQILSKISTENKNIKLGDIDIVINNLSLEKCRKIFENEEQISVYK